MKNLENDSMFGEGDKFPQETPLENNGMNLYYFEDEEEKEALEKQDKTFEEKTLDVSDDDFILEKKETETFTYREIINILGILSKRMNTLEGNFIEIKASKKSDNQEPLAIQEITSILGVLSKRMNTLEDNFIEIKASKKSVEYKQEKKKLNKLKKTVEKLKKSVEYKQEKKKLNKSKKNKSIQVVLLGIAAITLIAVCFLTASYFLLDKKENISPKVSHAPIEKIILEKE